MIASGELIKQKTRGNFLEKIPSRLPFWVSLIILERWHWSR